MTPLANIAISPSKEHASEWQPPAAQIGSFPPDSPCAKDSTLSNPNKIDDSDELRLFVIIILAAMTQTNTIDRNTFFSLVLCFLVNFCKGKGKIPKKQVF